MLTSEDRTEKFGAKALTIVEYMARMKKDEWGEFLLALAESSVELDGKLSSVFLHAAQEYGFKNHA